jgi:hypothetical protein
VLLHFLECLFTTAILFLAFFQAFPAPWALELCLSLEAVAISSIHLLIETILITCVFNNLLLFFT